MKIKFFYLAFIFILFFGTSYAQKSYDGPTGKPVIRGYVKDSQTGEDLIGANVFIDELKTGVITNIYGFYSMGINPGKYRIIFSYIGYTTVVKEINLTSDMQLDIELSNDSKELEEIDITAEKKDKNVKEVQMSVNQMPMKTIQKIPALMGEVDVLKSIQLLPGVLTPGEGSTGFYVRGGGVDQNLILLDDAPVYNAAHLVGIFSIFNQDAIRDVKLYKGAIPAEYGGRLSSVLDVRMKEGNLKKFSVKGGIGILASRLTVEGPIIKDKMSFIVSGRRTYFDVFFPMFKDFNLKDSKAFFYDFTAKVNYKISDNDRIFISGYFGQDIYSFMKAFEMNYGNKTFTIRHNHVFNSKVFSNITLIYSNFNYGLGVPNGPTAFSWESNIIDKTVKNDYTWYASTSNTVKFGINATHHTFKPGDMSRKGEQSIFNDLSLPRNYALEYGVFVSNEQKITSKLTADYGIRFSMFQNLGSGTFYSFDKTNPEEYSVIDTLIYKKGKIFKTDYGFEPRVGLVYQINNSSSVKASYNHAYQYIQMTTNTMSPTPFDIWFPSSKNIKPQSCDQFVLGFFKNLNDNMFETSIEAYYKKLNNVVDYCDHAEILTNPLFEGEIRTGSAEAYGVELFVKKQTGKLTGWVSYTYSRVFRDIPEINNGKRYAADYDKPHNISVVLSYDINPQINVSANWVYTTGAPRTMPTERFVDEGMVVPVYSERNAVRLPDYHRMDLSCTYTWGKLKRNGKPRKWNQSLNVSIYNLYNRHNSSAIIFSQDELYPDKTYAENFYMFKIFPSVTYNFSF